MDRRPSLGTRVRVKASGRVGVITQDDKDQFPYKIEYTSGEVAKNTGGRHADYFKQDDVEVVGAEAMDRPVLGARVRVKATGRVGVVVWDDKDHLPYKIRYTKGEMAKHDGANPEYFREDDVEEVGAEAMDRPVLGAKVRVTAMGRVGVVVWDDKDHLPYKIRYTNGEMAKHDGDYPEYFKEDDVEEVGAEAKDRPVLGANVRVKATGRVGVVVQDDKDHLPYRIRYTSGEMARHNGANAEYFKESDVEEVMTDAKDEQFESDWDQAMSLQQLFSALDAQSVQDRLLAEAIGNIASDDHAQAICSTQGRSLLSNFRPEPRRAASGAGSSMDHMRPSTARGSGISKPEQSKGRCAACLDTKKVTATAVCEHKYCDPCLRSLFMSACGDRTLLPVRCCRQKLDLAIAAAVLTTAELRLLEERTEEHCAQEKMYCPDRACGKFINLDKGMVKTIFAGRPMKCPHCARSDVCVTCKAPWHPGLSCRSYQQAAKDGASELAKVAHEMGWMPCPQCRTFVELRQGCNHITCVCSAEFCYSCGARWKTCRCELFSVPEEAREMQRRIRVQEQVLGRRVNALARIDLRQQIQRRECVRHRTHRVQGNCGNCRNCGFYMNCYGFVCTECSNMFCYVCVHHRM